MHWTVFLLRLLKDRQRANGMAPSLRHQRLFIKVCNIVILFGIFRKMLR